MLLIGDDVIDLPGAILFLPGFEVTILSLGYIVCGLVRQRDLVPAPVVSKIALDNDIDDDYLHPHLKALKELLRPDAKSTHGLLAVKARLTFRTIRK